MSMPLPERRVGDEPDAEFPQERQHLVFLVTGEQRVLRLEGGDGMHGMGAANGADPGLGKPDVADLAFNDQLGQGANRVLDRRAGDPPGAGSRGRRDPCASRRSDPSKAVRMLAGLLSRWPGPSPTCEIMPNFVASTTWSRRSLIASPTSSSLMKGP